MADMVRLVEIAKRPRIDPSTVRRLIAKEGDSLQLTLHRGKHDRLFLSSVGDRGQISQSNISRQAPTVASGDPPRSYVTL